MYPLKKALDTSWINDEKSLFTCSLLYLGIPYLLFFGGWFTVWIGLPTCLLLVAGGYSLCRQTHFASSSLKIYQHLILIVLSLIVCYVSEADLFEDVHDGEKHAAIMKDMASARWPVMYPENYLSDSPTLLCYYLGFYLVPATLGKLFGIGALAFAKFTWQAIGVYLSLFWFCRATKSFSWVGLFFFFLLGGLDLPFFVIRGLLHGDPMGLSDLLIGVNGELIIYYEYFRFMGNAQQILYTPQHSLPIFIVLGIFTSFRERTLRPDLVLFLSALVVFWSPLSAIGLVFFLPLFIPQSEWLKSLLPDTLAKASAILLVLLIGGYFLPHYPVNEKGLIWDMLPLKVWLPRWPLFLALEIGWILLLVLPALKQSPYRTHILVGTAILTILPLLQFGKWSDLQMRASIAPLYFFVLIFYERYHALSQSWLKAAFISLCLLGGSAYLAERIFYFRLHSFRYFTVEEAVSIPEVFESWGQEQYMADPEHFFPKLVLPATDERNFAPLHKKGESGM